MGCYLSKRTKKTPGYEEPTVLAAETPCEYALSKGSLLQIPGCKLPCLRPGYASICSSYFLISVVSGLILGHLSR
jgi:hypothetical protein